MNQLTALLPMRHDSDRVPGKNYRDLRGRPLYAHVLDTLLAIDAVDVVVIDTDSPVIRGQVAHAHPDVVLLDRPPQLRDGHLAMTEVLAHDAALVPSVHYLQTHSTNPLLRAETIAAAIDRYLDAYRAGTADSLFGVTRLYTRLYDAAGRPVNHDPAVLLRTQDLPPLFEENSTLYLFPRALVLDGRRRIGDHPLLHEVDPVEAVDIDTEHDFRLAAALYDLTAPVASRPAGGGPVASRPAAGFSVASRPPEHAGFAARADARPDREHAP